jgi:Domain of unknown function (DUF4864)
VRKYWLLILIAVAAGWWFWGRSLEPVRVIRAQLEAIHKENFPRAYGYLSQSARTALTPEQFEAQVRTNSVVLHTMDTMFLYRKIGRDKATIRGELEGTDGQECDASYVLVKDGEQWEIATFQWSRPRLVTD